MAAEQTFRWLNQFSQVKMMNECHYLLFFAYILDLHNLKVSGLLRETKPSTPMPSEGLSSSHEQSSSPSSVLFTKSIVDSTDSLVTGIDNLTFQQQDDEPSGSTTNPTSKLKCSACSQTLKSASGLTRHMKSIHNISKGTLFKCDQCSKTFSTKGSLGRHMKSHKD